MDDDDDLLVLRVASNAPRVGAGKRLRPQGRTNTTNIAQCEDGFVDVTWDRHGPLQANNQEPMADDPYTRGGRAVGGQTAPPARTVGALTGGAGSAGGTPHGTGNSTGGIAAGRGPGVASGAARSGGTGENARGRRTTRTTPSGPANQAEEGTAVVSWRNEDFRAIRHEASRADVFDDEEPTNRAAADVANPENPPRDTPHAEAGSASPTKRAARTSSLSVTFDRTQAKKSYKRLRLWYREKFQPFYKIVIAQLLCAIYILVATFSEPPLGIRDPVSGDVVDPNSVENTNGGVIEVNGDFRPVVAVGGWQKFCLAVSRTSAFSMYPMLVIVFATKMRALQTFFSRTPYSMYFRMIVEGHDYHVFAGRYIAVDVCWIHTTFHILRWASQGNISLLITSNAGLTGLVTIVVTPLIVWPMMYWRKAIRYEVRKALHYLFYVYAVAMCFHVPPSAVPKGGFLPYVLGGSIVIYALDTFYVSLFMTEKIETTAFHVLSSGVRISMPVSERFQRNAQRGGYAYINLPWINDKQWHPFSLFEDPADASIQQMFLMKSGDWTSAVHATLSRDTTRPVWIKGPFPSPFGHAALYDNQVLVASGIGITPALSAINAFKASRRMNLIWAVRDPEMLEFFLEKLYLDHDGWNLIFYTGKKPLRSELNNLSTNIKVIKGRPKLASVIPNVIYGIESKEGLPEKYTERSKDEMRVLLANRVVELERDWNMRWTEKVAKIKEYGEVLGFSLEEMIDEERFNELMSSIDFFRHEEDQSVDDSHGGTNLSSVTSRPDSKQLAGKSYRKNKESSAEDYAEAFLTELKSSVADTGLMLKPAFCPWEESASQERCVARFDDAVMSTWGIMYCGGSQPVISALKDISINYNIHLHIDSFAW